MTENEFENKMCDFEKIPKKDIEKEWLSCFVFALKKINNRFTKILAKDLFYRFEMDNWECLHLKNTKYAKYSEKRLYDEFCSEIRYIYDRLSYDRLFRTHWLFLAWKRFND